MNPGCHEGIPSAEYHALDAVSSSFLKKFRVCPASALIPTEPTPDMDLGRAIHAYSLEGQDAFLAEFAVMFESDLNKNTTAYKAAKAEFSQLHRGKTILPAQYKGIATAEILAGVDASLRSHPMAGRMLAEGARELSLVWDDPDTGLRCKARVDHATTKSVLVDLKKTADVDGFPRQMVSLSYDVQAVWYMTGANACGIPVDTFSFVAVEAEPPYPVRCGYLTTGWMQWATAETKRLLGLVKECRERNEWPAYRIPQNVFSLDQLTPTELFEEWELPNWR